MGFLDFLFKKNKEEFYSTHKSMDYSINEAENSFMLTVEDVFSISGRGTVVTGVVTYGSISVGDVVSIHRTNGMISSTTVAGIEAFRKLLDTANAGENVGILLRGIDKSDVERGDILRK
jgi:elongation factor Tu